MNWFECFWRQQNSIDYFLFNRIDEPTALWDRIRLFDSEADDCSTYLAVYLLLASWVADEMRALDNCALAWSVAVVAVAVLVVQDTLPRKLADKQSYTLVSYLEKRRKVQR